MLTEARAMALQRLIENASQQGAQGIVGVRFTTSAIMDGACEILAFGTAVKFSQ